MSHIGYPSYKDTGTPWLGAIPNHWDIKPLWSMFKRQKRTGHQSERLLSVYRDYGVIPKDSRDDNANKASEDLSTYQLVKPGDLAINKMKAWQGSVAISSIQGIVSPAYFIFTPSHHALPKYLHYLFRCTRYIAGYLAISKGVRVGQWDMDPDHHSRMPVVLPPRKEQEEIADFLDRETARIDSLIEKKTRFIELLKEKRQAVITKAVTKGIDSSAPMRDSGVKWLGNVPAHWHVSPLKHYLDRNDGGVWGDEPTSETDTIVLRSTEQAVDGSWQITDPARRKLSSSEISKSLLQEGDLLVTKSSGSEQHIGKTSLVTEDVAKLKACYSNFMQRLRVSHKTTPEFVALILNNRIAREQFAYQSNSTTGLANLTAGMIGEVECCFPPLHEQNELIENIHTNTTPLDLLSDKTNRSIELLKEHRSALITAAVTGKIDVRKSK